MRGRLLPTFLHEAGGDAQTVGAGGGVDVTGAGGGAQPLAAMGAAAGMPGGGGAACPCAEGNPRSAAAAAWRAGGWCQRR